MYKFIYKLKNYLIKNKDNASKIMVIMFAIICSCILLCYYKYGFVKQRKKFISNKSSIEILQKENNEMHSIRNDDNIINAKLDSMKDTQRKLNDALPVRNNIPEIISQITLTAQDCNININSMESGSEKTIKIDNINITKVSYDVVCYGEYKDFVSFLDNIEHNKSIFSIDYIKMCPPESMTDSSQVKTEILITIYVKDVN